MVQDVLIIAYWKAETKDPVAYGLHDEQEDCWPCCHGCFLCVSANQRAPFLRIEFARISPSSFVAVKICKLLGYMEGEGIKEL